MKKRVKVYSFSAAFLVNLLSEPTGYITPKGTYLAKGIPRGAVCLGLRQGKSEFEVDLLMEHPTFAEVTIPSYYIWDKVPQGEIHIEKHQPGQS